MPLILVLHHDVDEQAGLVQQVARLGFESTTNLSRGETVSESDVQVDAVLLALPSDPKEWRRRVEWFRARRPAMPLIALSRDIGIHQVMLAMAAGAYDYVQTPMGDGQLYASLTRAVELHELRRSMACLREGPTSLLRCAGIPPSAARSQVDPTAQTITPINELERQAIAHAMEVCNRSAGIAAAKLGISPATIYRKLKAYGIPTR
jgi:DNA-binding NtrC family response regulator